MPLDDLFVIIDVYKIKTFFKKKQLLYSVSKFSRDLFIWWVDNCFAISSNFHDLNWFKKSSIAESVIL